MSGISVFIVDDDVDFAESLAMILESRGCEVQVAHSGEEAVQAFRTGDFDIAFMDVKLPGMNGVESFLEIRSFKPEARVVMMTGYSVQSLLEQAVNNGAWGVLHKPLRADRVIELVSRVANGGIIVADDDPDFVASLCDILTTAGWSVITCRDGREALEQVSVSGGRALVMDLRMPVMDGLQAFREIRSRGHGIPVIIVTAYGDEEEETVRFLERNAVKGILHKPLDPADVVRVLETVTGDGEE